MSEGVIIGLMSDLWRVASEAAGRFAAQAVDYDRYRPRYPDSMFDDLVGLTNLAPGDRVIEIGAGTGIATEPLVDRGLEVTAIEPAGPLAALTESKVAGRARVVVGRFEDFSGEPSVQLLAAFNAWHWVDPEVGIDLAAQLLEPDGWLALGWTEVVSWGQEPFEERLAAIFGSPWPKREGRVDQSLQPVRRDPRFDDFRVSHHPFERVLDAATFVAVTKTYGGSRTVEQYEAIEWAINEELGGAVRKEEDAVLYLCRRA